jgi:L-ribulokinase
MSIVAGVDFGTLSVRVTIVDSEKGRLGFGTGEYPLKRKKEDPDYATQSHQDHMKALVAATHRAVASAGIAGSDAGGRLLPVVRSSRLEGSRRDHRRRSRYALAGD